VCVGVCEFKHTKSAWFVSFLKVLMFLSLMQHRSGQYSGRRGRRGP
jgi:hypothetical protein